MLLKNISIKNYKCFDNTGLIDLTPGINLVLGKNNVGKTAFLEALACNFAQKPFININGENLPIQAGASQVKVEMQLSMQELLTFALAGGGGGVFCLAYSHQAALNWRSFFIQSVKEMSREVDCLVYREATGSVIVDPKTYELFYDLRNVEFRGYAMFEIKKGTDVASQPLIEWQGDGNNGRDIFYLGCFYAQQNIYRFKAERYNAHKSSTQPGLILLSDSSNLASCLQQITQQPAQYKKICELVKEIFPDVHQIVTKNITNTNECEIYVWPIDSATERDSALIPLSECGTGVGQVLALLYVVVTSKQSRVIIIDEPNSFLHPGAAKKLIEILKRYSQHQYIISTHSPEIIKIADANNIILLTREDGVTKWEKLDPKNIGEMKVALMEMGVNISDVFGADAVLWVEGKTEEECFRLIADHHGKLPIGVSIVGVLHTSDFEDKKRCKDVVDIYKRLSGSQFLMPPAIGFIFDRENKTEAEITDLERASKNSVQFLPRKMFECYVLDAGAITHALNNLPSFQAAKIDVANVEEWLSKQTDLANADAAKVLAQLFSDFSDAKEEFRKTRDNIEMTKWLLGNKPEAFSDIAELMERMVKADNNKVANV